MDVRGSQSSVQHKKEVSSSENYPNLNLVSSAIASSPHRTEDPALGEKLLQSAAFQTRFHPSAQYHK